jgi:N-formylmaleamate deformylase
MPLRRLLPRAALAALLSGFVLACGHAPPPSAPEAPQPPPPFAVKVSGAGRAVVFLPDLQAPGDVWDTTVAHLGGRVEAHVVSIAGFAGLPAAAPGPVIPPLRDALARYLRERGKRSAIVVGHMFGATVAYALALSDPDLVAGIVAVDRGPTMGDGDPKEVAAEAEEGRRGLASASPETFAEMTKHRVAGSVASPETAARIAAEAAKSSQRTVADAFYEMMTLDLTPRLAEMKAPVLVIATMGSSGAKVDGDERAAFEASWHRQIDRIPRHTFVVIPGSRHYVMFDDPKAFFEQLDRFLETT